MSDIEREFKRWKNNVLQGASRDGTHICPDSFSYADFQAGYKAASANTIPACDGQHDGGPCRDRECYVKPEAAAFAISDMEGKVRPLSAFYVHEKLADKHIEGYEQEFKLHKVPLYTTPPQPQAAELSEKWWIDLIDQVVPDLSPEPDQNQYPAEWAVWADRQRIRQELAVSVMCTSEPQAAAVPDEWREVLQIVVDRSEQWERGEEVPRDHEAWVARAKALLSAQPQTPGDEWSSMDSAPKDGTEVLGWREDCGQMLMRYGAPIDWLADSELEELDDASAEGEDWFAADFIEPCRLEGSVAPQLWRHLPKPPQEG